MADIIHEVNGRQFALRQESDGDVVVWRAYELPSNQLVQGAESCVTTDVIADRNHTHQFDDPSEIAVNAVKETLDRQFGNPQ